VSCLGERITALVDGELDHDERDRALAHLAGCGQCRAEADAQRRLKQRLRSLNDASPSAGLLTRLYAMGEPGGPIPPRSRPMPGEARTPVVPRPAARRPPDNRPARRSAEGGRGWDEPERGRRRRLPRARYLAVGAATLAVLGVGTAGFVAGSEPSELPRVGPALEQFAVEHALTSGDVPVTDKDPAEEPTPRP
jgi:anti-sigma factor RsiW